MASISPTSVGVVTYTITGSKGVIADLTLAFSGTGDSKDFEIRYPTGTAGVSVTLVKGAATLALVPGVPISNHTATFAARRIDASVSAAGSEDVLSGTITVVGGGVMTDAWTLRLSATAPTTWKVTQVENDPMLVTITRVMCDPVATFSVAPSPVKEGQVVTLSALPATGPAGSPTLVKTAVAPMPLIRYNWTYTGTIAVPAFPDCTGSPVKAFEAPGVYGSTSLSLGLQVWYDGGCPSPVGDLTTAAANQSLTVDPRPHHLAVVLDRSGSMSGSRWENAKTAGRMLAHLFVALRGNVSAADRMTEIVFEDSACTWRASPVAKPIAAVLPLSAAAASDAAICGTDFGPAGSCTPIGDGLIRAMDDLAGLGVANDPRFTVVLLTDGYENSGTVKLNSNTPTPAGVLAFEAARTQGARAAVNAQMRLFAVGLGSSVDEQALNQLPLPAGTGAPGIYRKILNVGQLKDALAYMVAFSAGAEQVAPDPFEAARPRILHTEKAASRLAIGVLWSNVADDLTLERRDQGSAAWNPISVATKKCPTHGFLAVDVAALFGGAASVPASDWRVTHTSGGGPQDIPDGDILAFVDLFVRAELSFDRVRYRTGDPIISPFASGRETEPVTGARVMAELARPGQSLGTFLARYGASYKPVPPSGPDPLHPKAAMLAQLLQEQQMEELPTEIPQGIFTDDTDELFDDGLHDDGAKDDGNYANRFDEVDADGTYTWRLAITGNLPDGSAFSRLITVSKWVGVHIDPSSSPVTATLLGTVNGLTQTQVSIRPASKTGLFLGPFQGADVVIDADACRFETMDVGQVDDGIVYPAPDGGSITSHYDGTYSRTLVCREGEVATVTVLVGDEKLPPIKVGDVGGKESPLDWLWKRVRRVIQWPRDRFGL